MTTNRRTSKKANAPPLSMEALTDLIRETRARGGRRDLILTDQMPRLHDNELLVLVFGKHNMVARSVRLAQGQVNLRDLQLGTAGAASAVEEISTRIGIDIPVVELSSHERELLHEGEFEEPLLHSKQAADDGALEYLQLLRQSLSPDKAAELLKVNASRIRQRLGERRLYGVKDGRTWKLPRFQFIKRRLVPGIETVLPSLPSTMHPVAVSRWFRSPHADLELEDGSPLTPLEWLVRGFAPTQVTELAALL